MKYLIEIKTEDKRHPRTFNSFIYDEVQMKKSLYRDIIPKNLNESKNIIENLIYYPINQKIQWTITVTRVE